MPAEAPVWVEPARTGAVPIPMISSLAPPVATGIGLRGQQDSGRQDRRGGNEHSKLTHVSSPWNRRACGWIFRRISPDELWNGVNDSKWRSAREVMQRCGRLPSGTKQTNQTHLPFSAME